MKWGISGKTKSFCDGNGGRCVRVCVYEEKHEKYMKKDENTFISSVRQ